VRADDILAQIDHALEDWEVGPDAMRSRPASAATDGPASIRGTVPTVQIMDEIGEWQEIGVLSVDFDEYTIDQSTITPVAAQTGPTVTWEEIREPIVRIEAEQERRAQILRAYMQAFTEAAKPAVEAAGRAFAELQQAMRQAAPPQAPTRRRDRPAWQSPYGPARRRRRR
jgi:hypothetical protein